MMTPQEWVGLGVGTLMLAVVLLLARWGLTGGRAEHRARRRLVCPRFHEAVTCELVQDVRTGQWRSVESCSAFAAPQQFLCDQECRTHLNLGLRLSQP
jgi:hypothetical protein